MSNGSPARPATGRRSNSLVGGLIKRSRSSDLLGERKSSNNLMKDRLGEGVQQNSSQMQQPAPSLPSFQPQPQLQTFGGENYTPQMEPPPAPAAALSPTHTRTESMTQRGRYSYATSTVSSVNSPRRVRRRKDPTAYNVLVIGARNSGKTAFIDFLRSSISPKPEELNARNPELDTPPPSAKTISSSFVQHYQELEIEQERVGISIWDSQGFEKNVVDYHLREMINFVDSKFEDTFIEEMKVVRAPGFRDTHIHCVFFLFDPAQLDMNLKAAKEAPNERLASIRKPAHVVGALDEDFELQILRSLQGKTTVIPVISKADTVTTAHMAYLKRMVGESFLKAGLDPLEALHFEQSDGESDSLDEVEEEDEEDLEEKPSIYQSEDKGKARADDAPKDIPDTTPDMPSTENGTNGTAAEVSIYEQPQLNTKKPITHQRKTSGLSVSSVMFDNGYMPMSILSPDEHSAGGYGSVGRQFLWGFADPYNPQHCDFVKLKETCFTEWRADFKEASRDVFYERWRTTRLNRGPTNGEKKVVATAPATNTGRTPATTTTTRKPSSGIPIELVPRGKLYT